MAHVWTRELWSDNAERELGALIDGGRAQYMAELESGAAHLYRVEGPLYGGFFLIRFHETPKGIECYCIAFAGRNTAAGLPDLRDIVKAAGCVSLTCCTQQEAVARLYRKQGWKIEEYFLRLEL